MNGPEFEKVRGEFNAVCEKELMQKGPDYTTGKDRLDNFKRVAELVGVSPLVVWSVYFLKHVFAIQKFVRSGKLSSESIQSRFADARNYLDLGYGLVEEAFSLREKRVDRTFDNEQVHPYPFITIDDLTNLTLKNLDFVKPEENEVKGKW